MTAKSTPELIPFFHAPLVRGRIWLRRVRGSRIVAALPVAAALLLALWGLVIGVGVW